MLGAYPVQSGSALKMSPNHEASLLFSLYLILVKYLIREISIFYLTFELCMIRNKTFCFGFFKLNSSLACIMMELNNIHSINLKFYCDKGC